ncbi:MAG: tRNA adenosine(34) deaminase TadA [Clostridiales Family XIII bacterium]|jgi:tRNA(adenine34) deaminase|nr:tRNA adenosine(34) deaminase TadA [Clostridiales Family XIII bacterium]
MAVKRDDMDADIRFMKLAFEEALKAEALGEIPIGAVIVIDGEVVSKGYNRVETDKDSTMHAEMIAIRAAEAAVSNSRLIGATLYVTVEPCSMCAGAAVLAKISRIVAGTESDKGGACGTVMNILDCDELNHKVDYTVGIMREECSKLMSDFFLRLREKRRSS